MEILDVVDENGVPTGETVGRETAHAGGIRHRTSHVWIVRKRDGRLQVLLQKRSPQKDSFPGCWDISSAGHIPAGQGWTGSAVRELREELGCSVRQEELLFGGTRSISSDRVFHGRPFRDRQVTRVYVLPLDREPSGFTLQTEEVSEVRWFDLEDCLRAVRAGSFSNCIVPEELEMVRLRAGSFFSPADRSAR